MDLARRLKTVEDAENISPLQSEASQLSVFFNWKESPRGIPLFFRRRFYVPIWKRKLVSSLSGLVQTRSISYISAALIPSWSFHSTSHSSARVVERGRLHRRSPFQAGDIVLEWHLSFFLILTGRSVGAPHALISAVFHILK